MQPCQVCGGVAVDHNGYCTQCGTFRGQVTQPVSGTPYPPSQGGYQYPGGQPTSGAAWPGQTSATPYPFSGPPVSGSPGYPTPPPPTQRRPLFAVLIAASAVLVVLVGAIVVLAIARSDKHPVAEGTPTPGTTTPGATSAIDPCLIGTWKATSERQQQDYPGVGPVLLIGQGQVTHIQADGTTNDDYSQSTPYIGSYNGHAISMTVTGTVRSRLTTANGTLAFHDISANGTVTVAVDGTQAGSSIPLSVSSDPVQYTCLNKTATEHTDRYDATLTKTSDSP